MGCLLMFDLRARRAVRRYDAACRKKVANPQPPVRPTVQFARYWELIRRQPSLRPPSPPLHDFARLSLIYRTTSKLGVRRPPEIDPLRTRRGVALQTAAVRRVFFDFLKVSPTDRQAAVLARYGAVAGALQEFLEHCGLPEDVLISIPLGEALESFVARAELRHEIRATRARAVFLQQSLQRPGTPFSLRWLRGEEKRLRQEWARQDKQERGKLHRLQKRQQTEAWQVSLHLLERHDALQQRVVLIELVQRRYMEEFGRLVDALAQYDPTGEFSEREFMRAADRLLAAVNRSLRCTN
jgi:hypothetical protein